MTQAMKAQPGTMSFSRARFNGKAAGFRSGLEHTTDTWLKEHGIDGKYEDKEDVIRYVSPATSHRYTRDFRLPNGIIIETKGRFMPADRKKHLLIQQQHPHLDIRFVFTRSATRLSKASTTTYADWCRKNGIKFADKMIPEAWLKEKRK
jgi:hypothetical protein